MSVEEKDLPNQEVSFRDYIIDKIAALSGHPLDNDPHQRLNELLLTAEKEIDHPVFLDQNQQADLDDLISKIKWDENPEATTEAMRTVVEYLKK
jgi:hypothetical protein